MRWKVFRRGPCSVLLAILFALGAAFPSAASTLVDFEGDSVGFILGNDFTSNGVPDVHFIDTQTIPLGAGLFIVNEPFTNGTNALGAGYDSDVNGALRIALDFTATSITMDFFVGASNVLSYVPQAGDTAVLTAFMTGSPVGQVSQALDQQNILFDGAEFDSVELEFIKASSEGLTEFVDNVSVSPVPEPGAAVVFGAGALLVGAACGRRAGAAAGPRARSRC